jgi:hypothetical protein
MAAVAEQAAAIAAQLRTAQNGDQGGTEDQEKRATENKERVALPPRSADNRRVYTYLIQARGIDRDVVDAMIENNSLYEDAERHECVFVGCDGEAESGGKRYGWRYTPPNDSATLCVFRDPIEAMSHMSYETMTGERWDNKHYLSLDELSPEPLDHYLAAHQGIHTVILCLGERGADAAKELFARYTDMGYACIEVYPTPHESFNAMLLTKKQLNGG